MAAATPTVGASQTTPTAPATAQLPQGTIAMPGVLLWAVAWLMVIGVLWGISKTRWGHTITYYSLWLAVVLVVVSHGTGIATILTAGAITQGQQ